MNKKIKFSSYIFCILLILLLCVIGHYRALISDMKTDAVANASIIDTTSVQINILKAENKKLKEDLTTYKNELDNYKNMPENLLIKLRNSYESKDYFTSNQLIEQIHSLSNGTEIDIEAQKISKLIEENQEKTDIQKAKEVLEVSSTTVRKVYYEYIGGLKYMVAKINYTINCDNVNKIYFYIKALDTNGNGTNFYLDSSDDLFIIENNNSKPRGNYSDTFNVDWNNTAISKILIWKVEIFSENTKTILTNYSDNSKNSLKFESSKYFPTLSSSILSNGSSISANVKNETIVYITDTGSKYHSAGCQYLRKSQKAISKARAIGRGYSPCSKCNP